MSRYSKTPTKSIDRKPLRQTTTYIEIPVSSTDIYVYTTVGDRYDALAYQYYKDSSLWYIIALANPSQNFNSLTPEVGVQIRIPNVTTATSVDGLYS
jgi:hypothetical protein